MTVSIDEVEYLPAAAAAEQLATTELRILMLLREHALQGICTDGSWYVTAESLGSYQPGRPRPGKGGGCSSSCGASGCACA